MSRDTHAILAKLVKELSDYLSAMGLTYDEYHAIIEARALAMKRDIPSDYARDLIVRLLAIVESRTQKHLEPTNSIPPVDL